MYCVICVTAARLLYGVRGFVFSRMGFIRIASGFRDGVPGWRRKRPLQLLIPLPDGNPGLELLLLVIEATLCMR